MKKLIALTLILMFALPALVHAEATIAREMDALKIGVVTPPSGDFFTDMWGNNTTDIDVRALIHGYSTVGYRGDGNYDLDRTVVADAQVTDGAQGRTYTFTINGDLTYSDGTPITARDYVFSALLLSDPRMTDLGAVHGTLQHIAGYAEYAAGVREALDAGETPAAVFAGVRLIADDVFSLTIQSDFLPYFYELALVEVKPYPMHVIAPGCAVADDGEGAYLTGEFTQALLMETVLDPIAGYRYHPSVTSGPYLLTHYNRNTKTAQLAINPAYRGNHEGVTPQIARLTIRPARQDDMIEQLQSGELDLIHKVASGDRINEGRALTQTGEADSRSYLRAGLSFLSFSCEQGPTGSQSVRQAIALCADPQGLVDEFLQGYGLVSYGYYGYGQWMADGNDELMPLLARYTLNVNAAIGLLEQDGWVYQEDGSEYDDDLGGVRCRMAADGTLERLTVRWAYPAGTDAIRTLKPMLEANMAQAGFELIACELPFDQLLRHYYRQEARAYEMFFMGSNFALTFDPYDTFSTDARHQGVFNTTGILDEALMRLADEMRRVEPENQDDYLARWTAFQQRFVEVLPLAPLYGNIYFDFFRPDLIEYNPNAHFSIGSALIYARLGEPETVEVEEMIEMPDETGDETGDIMIIE